MSTNPTDTPKDWLPGLIQNWRNDLIAAVSVALVALPLCLGIAIASGVEPMSGVISAGIGGLVATWFRGSHLGINGPGNGLIAVIFLAVTAFGANPIGLMNVLGCTVIAGVVMTLLGLLRLGVLAELFPTSVIQGILAAIGIIIMANQLDEALGIQLPDVLQKANSVDKLKFCITHIGEANPLLAMIALAALLLLIFHARISYTFFHFLPAPMWVLILSVVGVFVAGLNQGFDYHIFGRDYSVGAADLIHDKLPSNPLDAILYPRFDYIGEGRFWLTVLAITIIGSVETLASSKAVEKLDPFKRKGNANKELIGNGLATMVSGCLGGLPVVTVIVRSTVAIHNNARTRWVNVFHSLLILSFVLLLSDYIREVPLAALAAILVFMGYRLASPRVFREAYEQGIEQLLFVSATMIITIYTNLIQGLIGGILITLMIHLLLSRVSVPAFFRMVFASGSRMLRNNDGTYTMKMKGVSNFLGIISLRKSFSTIPSNADVRVDFSKARLVDFTLLETLEDFKRDLNMQGGSLEVVGLDHHVSSSEHRFGLKSLTSPPAVRMTARQQRMRHLAADKNWGFNHGVIYDDPLLYSFRFFDSRPIEKKENTLSGNYPDVGVDWEISDITFDEGALLAKEVYHTTVLALKLPFELPRFEVEKEGFVDKFFDRIKSFSGYRDIDFKLFPRFSSRFLLKGPDEASITTCFTPELIRFLEQEEVYHIESNGTALLIFRYMRTAKTPEIEKMLVFSEQLVRILNPLEENRVEANEVSGGD